MGRLTECHNGVAVIKGKKFGEAAAKLALYEDIEEKGNFINLPFELGGTLYDIFEFVEKYDFPEMYVIDASKVEISRDEKGILYCIDGCDYREKDCGTTLFGSREEAHAAIEKLRNEV